MNRHLAIKKSCFSVVKLRNSPAQNSVMARVPRLESEYFNHNLLDPDLIRTSLDSLDIFISFRVVYFCAFNVCFFGQTFHSIEFKRLLLEWFYSIKVGLFL